MENSLSDTDLMLRFQQGDREAFDMLVLRHQVEIFNYFYRSLGDRHAAEDQTQDVFLRLYRHAHTYKPLAKFMTYLYRIAHSCLIDYERRNKRQAHVQSLDKPLPGNGDDDNEENLYSRLSAPLSEPPGEGEKTPMQAMLKEALQHLPPDLREVVILSEVNGMKYAEIAETMDIPIGTVKSRMYTAIQRLRAYLEKRGMLRKERR